MSYFNFLAFTESPKLRWNPSVAPIWGKTLLLGLLLLMLFFTFRVSLRLKKVSLNADNIRVSSYLREEIIGWPDVQRVVINGAFEGKSSPVVDIELRRPHPFGGRIVLLPAAKHLLSELTERAAAFGVKVEHR